MIVIEPMIMEHLDEVCSIENECFPIPWSWESFRQELEDNKIAIYIIAKDRTECGEKIVGYAGMWHVVTEGHITNIAVSPEFRRRGAGDALLRHLIALAQEMHMLGLTLEVRMGNESAMRLYGAHGFKAEGIRKNYYTDSHEDAVVMWKYFDK